MAGIARWYDRQPSRYGPEFLAEFLTALRAIETNPRLYSLAEDGVPGYEVREYFIARFKQRVIYSVTDTDALIISVVHAARRPGLWHRNLPTRG